MEDIQRTTSGLYTTVIRTLAYTDLVGSTSIVSRLGDEASARLFRRHDKVVRELIARFEGVELERTDGFLAMFKRPIDAVCYAMALHPALEALSADAGVPLRARAGLHMGEVVLVEVKGGSKDMEAEGMSRILCARLMGLGEGGQTLLTRGAWDLARRAAVDCENLPPGVKWLSHGPYLLKGVEANGEPEPVDVFEVGEEGRAPLRAPGPSEKARPVGAPAAPQPGPAAAPTAATAAPSPPWLRATGWGVALGLGIALGVFGAWIVASAGARGEPAAQGPVAAPRDRAPQDGRASRLGGAADDLRAALLRGDLQAALDSLQAEPSPRNAVLVPALQILRETENRLADPAAPLAERQAAMRRLLAQVEASGLPPGTDPETVWGAVLYLVATGDKEAEATIDAVRQRLPQLGQAQPQQRVLQALASLAEGTATATPARPGGAPRTVPPRP